MFACPLFREFLELNETAKLKGVNIDTVPNLIGKKLITKTDHQFNTKV